MSESDGWTRRPSHDARVGSQGRAHGPEGDLFSCELKELVNHHLRTPLTVLMCHAELLAEAEHDVPAAVHASHLAMLRAARRLSEVVVGLCDLVATSVEPLTLEAVDIPELVREEVRSYEEHAARHGVRFLVSSEITQPCVTDPERLRQALRELFDNAVTYAPDDSTVRVASGSSASGIRIEVFDQGAGMGAADRERRTGSLARGTRPWQPVGGPEMGLALAVVLAASLGGRLLCAERSGPGLEVCLVLPVDLSRHDAAPLSDRPDHDSSRVAFMHRKPPRKPPESGRSEQDH